jgi:hypothetical protein
MGDKDEEQGLQRRLTPLHEPFTRGEVASVQGNTAPRAGRVLEGRLEGKKKANRAILSPLFSECAQHPEHQLFMALNCAEMGRA